MSDSGPISRPASPRAEALIAAWNRRDIAFVLDQFSDAVRVEARSPKKPDAVLDLDIRTKDQLAAALEAYRPLHSRFSIISSSENISSILLTLEDAEGDILIITLVVNDDGKIDRITSYRSRERKDR